jgi:hypothetical protein
MICKRGNDSASACLLCVEQRAAPSSHAHRFSGWHLITGLLWPGLCRGIKMSNRTVYACLAIVACLLVATHAADRRRPHPHSDDCPPCEGRDTAPPPGNFEYFVLQKYVSDFRGPACLLLAVIC